LSESFRSVFELALESQGTERTAQLLEKLAQDLRAAPRPSASLTTPYVNTIPLSHQPEYPATASSSGASRASCAGTRWRWW